MQKLNSQSKFFIQTYGCQMNHSDSERFDKVLTKAGLQKATDFSSADLLVFNSCSVKQKAEDRILGLGNIIDKIRETNPNLVTVLTGCMAKRVWDDRGGKVKNWEWRKKLQDQMPWLDMIIETKDFNTLVPELFNHGYFDNEKIIKEDKFYDVTPNYKSKFQAFLPISTGCDHFCTYCIVPYARGREECRSFEVIKNEFQGLVDHGFKDITLLGQIVNRWINPDWKGKVKYFEINSNKYNDPKAAVDFLQLLEKLDEVDGDFWLTFTSSHPMYFQDEIIDFFAKSKHIRPYLHFAMQSGNDEVLKNMRRDYTYGEFRDIVLKFKERVPGMAISTDIIAGFPGETEEQFIDTAYAMEELEFDMAFISEYSPRLGTKSAQMTDDIEHKEKERRKLYLNEILRKTSRKQKEEDVGQVLKCLPYKNTKYGTVLRTIKNREVQIDQTIKLGEFVNIQIESCSDWALKGKFIE